LVVFAICWSCVVFFAMFLNCLIQSVFNYCGVCNHVIDRLLYFCDVWYRWWGCRLLQGRDWWGILRGCNKIPLLASVGLPRTTISCFGMLWYLGVWKFTLFIIFFLMSVQLNVTDAALTVIILRFRQHKSCCDMP